MKALAVLFMLGGLAAAEPQPPADRMLDPVATMKLGIHSGITTLLVFPEAVTLIAGAGLTDGKSPGDVHYQHAENPKHLVLQQLKAQSTVLMQVAMGEQTYAFQLTSSDQPTSIIRFHKNPVQGPAVELSEDEVRKWTLNVSKDRQAQLIHLVHAESVLRTKLPEEYAGYSALDVSYVAEHEGLRTTIERVARFRQEDTLVFLGKVYNGTAEPVDLRGRRVSVLVGEQEVAFPATYGTAGQTLVPSGNQVDFTVVLVGDGRGLRLHLDPRKNRFTLSLKPHNP